MPLRPISVTTSPAPTSKDDAEQHLLRAVTRLPGRVPRAAVAHRLIVLAEIGGAHRADRRGSRPASRSQSRCPSTSTVMRSASAKTASMSCSTSRIVVSALEPAQQLDHALADSCAPMPAIGSSSSSRRGCIASAIASSSCRLFAVRSARRRRAGLRRRARRGERPSAAARAAASPASGARSWNAWPLCRMRRDATFSSAVNSGEDRRDLERTREPGARARHAPAAR